MLNLSTQLSDEIADKLTYIQQHTDQSLPDALTTAIDTYYHQLKTTDKQPWERLSWIR